MNTNDVQNTAIPGFRFWALLIAGIALTLATGLSYGALSQRWGPSVDLVKAGLDLAEMPKTFGDWELLEEKPIPDFAIRQLACEGYVNRRYVNSKTGEIVAIAVIVGPPGPIAVHTPEICFSSQAYKIQQQRSVSEFAGNRKSSQTLWNLTFLANNETADGLHVYYGWNAGDGWVASQAPRYEFATKPMLYKLQLAAYVPNNRIDSESDAGQRFLQDLLLSGWNVKQS